MTDLSIREIFPKKLLHYMKESGKTRRDIEHDLGFSYSTIRDWEKGLTVPRMDKIELLANYFNCKNSDLLENKKEKPTAADDGLSAKQKEVMELLMRLSPSDLDRAVSYLQFLAKK